MSSQVYVFTTNIHEIFTYSGYYKPLWLLHYKNSFLDKNKILRFSFSLGLATFFLSPSPPPPPPPATLIQTINTSHIPLDLYALQKPKRKPKTHCFCLALQMSK